MSQTETEPGRAAQRRRTRAAIVSAAAGLLAEGRTPTMAEVAERADVSRRTAYLYFPTTEQLLIDASLLSITRDTVDAALDAVDASDDVEARVEALARAVHRLFGATEQHGRRLLRLTLDAGPEGRPADQPVRGYRRVAWIERALAPLRRRVTPARFERLVSALATVIGWEALIVERDIRALGLDEAEELSVWSARALVRATLAEAGVATRRR